MTLFYKKTNHLKTNSETTLNCHETVLQFKCKNAVIENNKSSLSYKYNFNFFKLKQNFNTIPMSTILPNCISRLVTNRSQQTSGSHNHNNPIKHLLRSFALLFLLLGFNSMVNAQTGPNDDFDGDGIVNSIDIDDDNDGVIDAVESPTCFFKANDWNIANKSAFATVTTQLNMSAAPNNNLAGLTDGVGGATGAVQFVTGQSALNKEIFKIELAVPTQVDAIYIQNNATVFNMISSLTLAGSIKVQGSNDNTAWTDVTAATTWPALATNVTANGAVSLTNSVKFPLTTNLGKYKYYRIYGVLGALTGQGIASEIYLDVNNATYQASLYPNATCTADLDGDTKMNHQDLDADGDGCSDAKEAGASSSLTTNFVFPTTSVGTNGLPDAVETVADNGTINYVSTYTNYAVNALVNACTDTDNDGISDLIDIDDDNDGVLDTTEMGGITTGNYSNLLQSASTGTGTLSNACKSVNFTLATTGTVTVANTHPTLGTLVVSNSCLFNNSNFSPMLASANTSGFRFEGAAGAKAGTISFTFAQPVTNPIIYLSNIDSKYLDFASTVGLSAIVRTAGNSSFLVQGSQVGRLDQGAAAVTTNVFSSCTAVAGGAGLPGFGSIRLIGTFTTITADVVGISGSGDNILYNIALDNLACDTDTDGKPDYLDTDSDGDGCSDAKEAGATTSLTPNFAFTGTMGVNGLDNSLETTADNGIINYVSTYNKFALSTAINACLDSDLDGITDLIDVDDDNDGVLDAIESPTCFYSANNWNTLNKSDIMSVTTDLNLLSPNNNLAGLTNADGTTAAVQYVTATAQSQLNTELLKLELSRPTQLDFIYLKKTSVTEVFNAAANSLKVQGSNNDVTWTDLTAAITLPANATNVTNNGAVSLVNSNKFALTTNLGAYKYYRIIGVTAVAPGAGILSEIYVDVNVAAYQASLYPTATCTVANDTDGKLNHLDLDSDGDGCSDAKEAGTTTSLTTDFAFPTTGVGTNGLDNTLETAIDNGIYKASYTYYFANNALVNACADTDSDGFADVSDMDDDNDGITDCAEGITKPFNFSAPAVFTNRNVDEDGLVQFTSTNVLTGAQQLNAPVGDANGNIGLAVNAGVGMQTGYNLAFTVPTGVMISSKGISTSGF